jgi:peptide/nickel transport system permease protein
MTLPLSNLVILGLAGHVLLMRNSMLEVMGEDYILTAKAKGLSERKVMYRHAARNALLPVVTALAISIGGVISGGVLTETIFSWPGMGYFLVTSTLQQDYPSVQAAFFILAVLTILANTVADVLYAWLDPRVRL